MTFLCICTDSGNNDYSDLAWIVKSSAQQVRGVPHQHPPHSPRHASLLGLGLCRGSTTFCDRGQGKSAGLPWPTSAPSRCPEDRGLLPSLPGPAPAQTIKSAQISDISRVQPLLTAAAQPGLRQQLQPGSSLASGLQQCAQSTGLPQLPQEGAGREGQARAGDEGETEGEGEAGETEDSGGEEGAGEDPAGAGVQEGAAENQEGSPSFKKR